MYDSVSYLQVKNLIKENTFLPGNFSTLYRCSKEKVQNMVNRLSYDPYERREQLMLADNPEGLQIKNIIHCIYNNTMYEYARKCTYH